MKTKKVAVKYEDNRHKLLEEVRQAIPPLNMNAVLMVNDRAKPRKRASAYGKPNGYYDMTLHISFKAEFSYTMHRMLGHENEGLHFPYGVERNVGDRTSELMVVLNSSYLRTVRSIINKAKLLKPGDWDFQLIALSLREDSTFLHTLS